MTFDREAKGITFGLLALLAIVGNYGLIDWFLASREISISIWLAVLAAMLALVHEIVVLGKVTESGDWTPGLAVGTLGLLVILFLFSYVTVRFAFTFYVVLSWFGGGGVTLIWSLLIPGFGVTILYFFCANVLHDEDVS